ncbi:MAG: alanine racemase [Omnitrophica WOR_2 bacterium RIFCSPLOWO2_01_FULL_41_12]|nr:MAG: alanine racemase [Omnitrophica WOR_2 bacterium RIFCSPLOWO2_01_FULL_41_12]
MPDKNQIGYRPTWAEINLRNLAYNFQQIKKLLGPKPKIMVTVKADAYGHGLIPVAKKLISCGVDYLGTASIDEGIKLRKQNIRAPILVLGMFLEKDIAPLFRYKLIPAVCTEDLALALNKRAKELGKPIDIHIKVDTGMGRLGVLHTEAFEFVKKIYHLKFINIQGIFTHFPLADADKKFTLSQINLFNRLIERLKSQGINIPLVHAANSMGVIGFKQSHFNLVRPGLVIYGLYPKKNLALKLKPVLSLKTKIIYFKKFPPGFGISYGHTYFTKKNTTIVTLPIGYGDGYPRNLSNRGPVLIGGKHFQVSGRICMDQIMVDVGSLSVRPGDEVVLIGAQGKQRITAEELAGLSETISYEIVCGLGSRIPRVYIE